MRGRRNQEPVVRSLVTPRNGEVIGLIVGALGAANFRIICSDKKERICSIPGRLKRRFWIKEGDLVVVKPWIVQGDSRGDIVWRYSMMDRDLLRQKGYEIPK